MENEDVNLITQMIYDNYFLWCWSKVTFSTKCWINIQVVKACGFWLLLRQLLNVLNVWGKIKARLIYDFSVIKNNLLCVTSTYTARCGFNFRGTKFTASLYLKFFLEMFTHFLFNLLKEKSRSMCRFVKDLKC